MALAVQVAVAEMPLAVTFHQCACLPFGSVAVVGMDEVEQRTAVHFAGGMAQQAFEGSVDEQDMTALVHDADGIGQQVQHLRKRGQAGGHGVRVRRERRM